MPLTKDKKKEVVALTSDLINTSKLTVVAQYQGISVKQLQQLRKQALTTNTIVKVIKNRLVRQALKNTASLVELDTTSLKGMLVYAFNDQDEIASAKSLYDFSLTNNNLKFIGAITPNGEWLSADEVTSLAKLPAKNVLIAQVIAMLNAPITSVMSSVNGALPGILSGLEHNLDAAI